MFNKNHVNRAAASWRAAFILKLLSLFCVFKVYSHSLMTRRSADLQTICWTDVTQIASKPRPPDQTSEFPTSCHIAASQRRVCRKSLMLEDFWDDGEEAGLQCSP